MKYKIMLVRSQRDNYESLYQFLTTTIDGVIQPVEIDTEEKLDMFIEDMFNVKGYSKNDFVIVQIKDYDVKTDIYNLTK